MEHYLVEGDCGRTVFLNRKKAEKYFNFLSDFYGEASMFCIEDEIKYVESEIFELKGKLKDLENLLKEAKE